MSRNQKRELETVQHIKRICKQIVTEIVNRNFASETTFDTSLVLDTIWNPIATSIAVDVRRFVKTDHATDKAEELTGKPAQYVIETYKGLAAIISYRVANSILNQIIEKEDKLKNFNINEANNSKSQITKGLFLKIVRQISETAAKETTIEINPGATIGKGFVIDHGTNTSVDVYPEKLSTIELPTVIGERCVIGENCTILQGVVLGATNPFCGVVLGATDPSGGKVDPEKRHPKIGHDVTICGGVRIIGNITVGNHVFIAPCCVITKDIPDYYIVSIMNQLQCHRLDEEKYKKYTKMDPSEQTKVKVDGLVVNHENKNQLVLAGDDLANVSLSIVVFEKDGAELKKVVKNTYNIHVISQCNNHIIFRVSSMSGESWDTKVKYSLHIEDASVKGSEQILFNPLALTKINIMDT